VHYQHSYLRARSDLPGRRSPDGNQGAVSGDLLSHLRAEPELALVAYSPLLAGGYVRPDKPLGVEFDHPGTATRLAALRAVAEEAGAAVNQVVLAWLIGGEVPAIPLVGASSDAQLNERLAAVDLELTADQRTWLDAARMTGVLSSLGAALSSHEVNVGPR
jgi:aryl-alcohol dehydrogenase-like predicted oxidoreductase